MEEDCFHLLLSSPLPRRSLGVGVWTVLAAQLAELRPRLLLPDDTHGKRRAQADAEALQRQLLSRAAVGAVADWLQRRQQLGRDVFARGRSDSGRKALAAGPGDRPEQKQAGDGDIVDLLRACLVALRVPEGAQAERPRRIPLWTVAEAIARVQRQIGAMPDGSALPVFLPRIAADLPDRDLRCRAALASTLLAGLELARSGAVTLDQEQPWKSIHVSGAAGGSDHTDTR